MDNRRKKVLIVLCVGGGILVWRLYVVGTKYLPHGAQASPVAVDPSSAPGPTMAIDTRIPAVNSILEGRLAMQRTIAEKPWGRNPFDRIKRKAAAAPPGIEATIEPPRAAPPAPTIELTGVSHSGDVWLAAINGAILRAGDSVEGGFTLRRVTGDSVTLESQGWGYRYKLGRAPPRIWKLGESNAE